MMTSKDVGTRKKAMNEIPPPPGFSSSMSFTLKRTKRNDEACNLAGIQSDVEPGPIESSFRIPDAETLQRSLNQRPWILHDQLSNPEKLDRKHLNNISVENTLPKGVLRGCSSCDYCQKVVASWRPEDSCRPVVEYAPVFHPTEEEFKDTLQYIAKIRPKAEKYGICRIVPPDSWKLPSATMARKWESSKFHTRVQQIDELRELHSKRKLDETIEQAGHRRTSITGLDNGSNGFEFECGPEFTLRTFKQYAEYFKGNYFQKKDMFIKFRTADWENIEGEYWRIVQFPTEQIQVLCAHNLEEKVFGSGFPSTSLDDSDLKGYTKSGWNLNNTPKLTGSLLTFDHHGSALSTPHVDVGMCFSSICWKAEEHHLYCLSYMHVGASRVWYGIPGEYHRKCEAALKKMFPELSRHPELFHKLVTQLSPATLKSEGIPVYRCIQHPKQFVLIFPGAYYSAFDTGFSVSEKVNIAPLDWLPHGQLTVETYSERRIKTSISYDKLLMDGAKYAAKASWSARLGGDFEQWENACGKDGWFTRALKSRLRCESLKMEFLCNASQSRTMELDFGSSVKRECFVCFYDLYLSAAGCPCSPDKYSCLEHSKHICTCPWSARRLGFGLRLGCLCAGSPTSTTRFTPMRCGSLSEYGLLIESIRVDWLAKPRRTVRCWNLFLIIVVLVDCGVASGIRLHCS